MKKLLALTISLSFAFSLAACGQGEKVTNAQTTTVTEDVNTIQSFDDFKDKLDEIGNIKEKITENGDIVVELETPTTSEEDKDNAPAVPTIDKVQPTTPNVDKNEEEKYEVEEITKPTEPEKEEVKPETVKPVEPTKPTEPETSSEPEVPVEPEKPIEPEKEQVKPEAETPVAPSKPTYTYTTNQKHQKLSYTKRYLYNILNDEQKGWYRQIDAAVNNLEVGVKINAELYQDRNYYIYFLYMADNPEHFYLVSNITIINYGDGTATIEFGYSVGNNEGEYCKYGVEMTDALRQKIIAKKAIFDAEVNRIVSTIPANAPDVWKERLIYERILLDSYYNLSAKWDYLANDNWTAYGILVNKYGVCESYSEAFQTLCFAVGINCMGVVGTAGGGHKWNAVELDGEWYMCDITFDDPIGGSPNYAYHYYFNRTSQWFVENNHNWDNCEWPVPNCNGTKYGYDNYF